MDAYDLAKKYYPRLWNIERIKALTAAERLNADQFKEITGEDYK